MDRETLEQRTIFPQGTLIKTSLDLSLKAAIRPAFVTDGVVVGNIIHNYPFGAATTASRNTTTTTTTTTHHHQDDEGSIPRFSNDSVTKHRTAKRERERETTHPRSPPFKQPFASETKYQHGARHKERKKHSPKVRHAVCTAA